MIRIWYPARRPEITEYSVPNGVVSQNGTATISVQPPMLHKSEAMYINNFKRPPTLNLPDGRQGYGEPKEEKWLRPPERKQQKN